MEFMLAEVTAGEGTMTPCIFIVRLRDSLAGDIPCLASSAVERCAIDEGLATGYLCWILDL